MRTMHSHSDCALEGWGGGREWIFGSAPGSPWTDANSDPSHAHKLLVRSMGTGIFESILYSVGPPHTP